MGSSETASTPWPKSKTLPASPCSPPIVSSPPHPPTPSSTAPARLAPPNLTKSRRLKVAELPLSSTPAASSPCMRTTPSIVGILLGAPRVPLLSPLPGRSRVFHARVFYAILRYRTHLDAPPCLTGYTMQAQ